MDSNRPGRAEGDRRCYFTLLFSDLCDYTVLNEFVEPDETIELRRKIEERARNVIPKHGGIINQFVGDSILAFFGFPEPQEDCVRRAIDAALELHETVRSLESVIQLPPDFSIRLHSGIHAGTVFVREGDPLHGRYELTGDAVNTAARLCSSAGKNEVLVSELALRGFETFFETELVMPLQLKGKAKSVSAYRVLDRSDVQTRFEARSRRGLTPFVGRVSELGELDSVLSTAKSSRGGTVCVVGDAGVGKTRLLDEFRRRASGFRVYRGSCENYGGIAPLRPFLQIVREVLAIPPGIAPSAAPAMIERRLKAIDDSIGNHLPALLLLLSLTPWPATGDDELQLAVIAAVTETLLAVARKETSVLMIDDWQWADDASKQVLGRLTRAIHDTRSLVVVGLRSVGVDDPLLGSVPTIHLRPFTEEESWDAVQKLLEQRFTVSVAEGIHRRCGGNPLFLEELCQSLPEDTEYHEGFEEARLPSTVHGLIHARVSRLEPAQADVLRAASVIGNEFSRTMLEAIGPARDVRSVLAELVGVGVIHSADTVGDGDGDGDGDQTFRFKHGIMREVVYESVRIRDRRHLHAEIARVLEQIHAGVALADHYEALASHYSGAVDYMRALEYAELAGDKAAARSALDRARAQYAAALRHIDHIAIVPEVRGKWLSIVAKWAATCVFNPARSQLDVLAQAAVYAEELGRADMAGRVDYWRGWIHYALGEQVAALAHLQSALEVAERGHNEPLISQLLSSLGQSHAAAGSYTEALDLLERGVEMKRARGRERRQGVPVGFAYALGCKALVLGDRGEFDAAYPCMEEALTAVAGKGHAVEGSLLCLLGMIQLWQGRWDDALQTAARGRATGERFNGPYVLAICRTVGGYASWALERTDSALEELQRAVRWLERRDVRLYLSFSYCHLAHALLEAGRIDSAREYAEKALLRAEESDPVGEAMAHRTLAHIAEIEQRHEAATHHCDLAFRSASGRASEREAAMTQLTMAEIQMGRGEREGAFALLDRAKKSFDALEMPWHGARADRLLQSS